MDLKISGGGRTVPLFLQPGTLPHHLPVSKQASKLNLTFMGPCIVNIFQYISNKMQRYTVYLYVDTALHVSGGTSSHHQERIQLYLQYLELLHDSCR